MTALAPIEAYQQRAANVARPLDYTESAFWVDPDALMLTAINSRVFWTDISHFQPVVNATYPSPLICCRSFTGYGLDETIQANWAECEGWDQIKLFMSYGVVIPGQLAAYQTNVINTFGKEAPPQLVLMPDMESGKGFAGPGDHSKEGNAWLAWMAEYLGDDRRTIAYANHYDFADNWPTLTKGIKRITAAYGTQDPGTYAWQFKGGSNKYGVQTGFPTGMSPFGTYVDLNTIGRPIDQVLLNFGITKPPPKPAPGTEVPEMIMLHVDKGECKAAKVTWPGVFLTGGDELRQVPHNRDVAALQAAGVKLVACSLDFYRKMGGK